MAKRWLAFTPNDLPIIQVNLGPQRFFALLDTGAQISLLSPKVAASFGLTVTGQTLLVGITGVTEFVPKTSLEGLHLAGIPWDPLTAVIADVTRMNKKIDLVLGISAFRDRRVQIDFKEGRVYLLD